MKQTSSSPHDFQCLSVGLPCFKIEFFFLLFNVFVFWQMNMSTNAVEADLMSFVKLNKVRKVVSVIILY